MSISSPRPRLAWTTDPLSGAVGLTHATYPGQTTALCGASTPFLDGPWPVIGQEWPASHSRCPPCARHLAAGRRP